MHTVYRQAKSKKIKTQHQTLLWGNKHYQFNFRLHKSLLQELRNAIPTNAALLNNRGEC